MQNIYYLGPNGSNSHKAAIKFLDICKIKSEKQVPLKSIKFAISELIRDKNSVAVLPIENSIEGIVRETIDNILKINDSTLKIQGELTLDINHMFLSTSNDISKITKIYSHPQGLAQCSKFIFKYFPNAELKEVSSTSYAAEKISIKNDDSLAAIANETCANIFNLNILAKNINDEKDNKTRFYILGRMALISSNTKKTAIIISPKVNRAGVLCDILKIFAKYDINLSYIDSRPSKKHLGEYIFFLELDGCQFDDKIKLSLFELEQYTDFIKVLGSFNVYND